MRKNRWKRAVCLVLLCATMVSLMGFAGCTTTVTEGEIPGYSLIAEKTAIDESETNISLECTLEGGVLTDTLSSADIRLDYGLSGMTIDSLERLDDTRLALALSGEIDKVYDSAQVTLLSTGIVGAEYNAQLFMELIKPQVLIDYYGITMEAGIIRLPVKLYQCAFEETAGAENFYLTGLEGLEIYTADIEILSETEAVVSLMAEGFSGLDEVLEALDTASIDGAALMIEEEALNSKKDTAIELDMPFALIYPELTAAEKNSDGSYQVACVLSGYFSEEIIDGAYITLGGDFVSGGEYSNQSSTLTENGETLFSFTISADAQSEDHMIHGTITLAPGAMTNPWGTPSEEQVYELAVSPEDLAAGFSASAVSSSSAEDFSLTPTVLTNPMVASGEGLIFDHAIAQGGGETLQPVTVADELAAFENLVLVFGDIVGGFKKAESVYKDLKSVYDIGVQIGTIFGWIPPKQSSDQKILSALDKLDGSVKNLSAQIDSLTEEMKKEAAVTRVYTFGTRLDNMRNIIKSFDVELLGNIHRMLGTQTAEQILAGEMFESLDQSEKEHALRYTQDVIDRYKDLKTRYNESLNKQQIINGLGGDSSMAAIIVLGKQGQELAKKYYNFNANGYPIYAEFKGLCQTVTGEGINRSILQDFDYIVDSTYNWEPEAYPLRAYYRAYIQAVLLETSELLNICATAYNPYMSTADLSGSYTKAMTYMTQGAGKTVDRSPPKPPKTILRPGAYCLTLNASLAYLDFGYSILSAGKTASLTDTNLNKLIVRANKLGRTLAEDMIINGIHVRNSTMYIAARPVEEKREGIAFYEENKDYYGYASAIKVDDRTSTSTSRTLIKKRILDWRNRETEYFSHENGFFAPW